MDELVEQGPMFSDALPPNHRSGFVALAGKPNVGKSTLLNAWVGTKIAAVSAKPQTTRNVLLGILTRADAQIIFIDTPGIHLPRTRLADHMVDSAKKAIPDADLVLFIVDVSNPPSRADVEVAEVIRRSQARAVLTLNKADLVSSDVRAQRQEDYQALGEFDSAVAVSALVGDNLDKLLGVVVERLPFGPRYYPEDQLSDQQERFIVAEMIREQVLGFLEQEVPHAVAVGVQDFEEQPNGLVRITADIYTEKESQKGIVIGRRGSMLKRIGREARLTIEEFLGKRVYLELWVKVRKGWRSDERFLRNFGYSTDPD